MCKRGPPGRIWCGKGLRGILADGCRWLGTRQVERGFRKDG